MTPNEVEVEINVRLAAAERLLASAAMVGDQVEHRLWQGSRNLWTTATAKALEGKVDENVVRTFNRATTPPAGEGTVSEDLAVELDAVRHGMAVLIGVRAQMQRDVAEPPPGIDRRGRRLGP
jgi:hypothetical protein